MANHNFNITLAKRFSIEEAIIIEHLYWWIHRNECNDEMQKDGRTWCYSSAKGFERYIEYMNSQKIRRVLLKLEERGIILIANYNKAATNQTLWYAFSDDFIKELDELGYDFSKMKNGNFKNEKSKEYNINEDIDNNKKNNSEELSKKGEQLSIPLDTEYDTKVANFNKYMTENYPLVQKMKEPLTYEQFLRLCDEYDRQTIYNVLADMNNWAELRKKRISAYQTALKWLSNTFRTTAV